MANPGPYDWRDGEDTEADYDFWTADREELDQILMMFELVVLMGASVFMFGTGLLLGMFL